MSNSSILEYVPLLSYIGAVDITSGAFGSTMYSVLYDSAISSLGNVLMFEYKFIEQGDPIMPPNVTFGSIAIENATRDGITNQYSISIPSSNYEYNPLVSMTVAIRVYIGRTDTHEIGVTLWSNELAVHNPPPMPVIHDAYYDAGSINPNKDDLYVFLNLDSAIDYDQIKFVAAFYYKNRDSPSTTIWDVSAPIVATPVSINGVAKRMIHVSEFGNVSTTDQMVYVSIYAVYEFVHDTKNYYSVSSISITEPAEPATNYAKPTVTSIGYSVYDSPETQNMTVNWTPPDNAGIPTYTVDHYILKKSLDNSDWVTVYDNINSTSGSQEVDVSSDIVASSETVPIIYFQVTAVSTAGTLSPVSETTPLSQLHMFKHATAPTSLLITDITYGETNGMTVNFSPPVDNGYGTPIHFEIKVNDNLQPNQPYIEGQSAYSVELSGLSLLQTGTVEVYLVTSDTNSNPDQNGASIVTSYVATNLVLNPVDYKVYDHPESQDMILTWNDPVAGLSGWTVQNYKVYRDTDIEPITIITNGTVTYLFDASSIGDVNIEFHIVALLKDDSNVEYSVASNTQSINTFTRATAPTDLLITNITYTESTGDVGMTVNFSPPVDNGYGTPIRFEIKVNSAVVASPAYDYEQPAYSVDLSVLGSVQTDTVEVYLVTRDTNSNPDQNGASISRSYIATNVVLDAVNYQVYDHPESQDMILTWSDPVDGLVGWTVQNYKVYRDTDIEPITIITNGTVTYLFDATNSGDVSMSFYIIASLTDIDSVQYTVRSNTQSINTFKYASAPTDLLITNLSYSSLTGAVGMTVNFTSPSLIYSNGEPDHFEIKVNSVVVASPLAGQSPYSVDLSGLGSVQTDTVEVYLVTKDTNSPNGDKIGASAITSYIATNLMLGAVDYKVYADNESQDMILTWNNPVAGAGLGGWSVVDYTLKHTYDGSTYMNVIGTTTNTNGDVTYTFDATNSEDVNIEFQIVATVTNNVIEYSVASNTQSIYTFKRATAPTDLLITNLSYSSLTGVEITVNFTSPSNIGYGEPDHFKIVVNDEAVIVTDNSLNYGQPTYSIPVSISSQTGTVEVYLITNDTNSSERYNGASIVTSYVATNLVLQPVDYQVYVDRSQDMILTWNDPVAGLEGWVVDNFKVYYTVNGVRFLDVTMTPNSTPPVSNQFTPNSPTYSHTFDAEAMGVDASGNNISFEIETTLRDASNNVEYIVTSNAENINTFKYASAPTLVNVLWSAVNEIDPAAMDIRMQFSNPTNKGYGTFVRFDVKLYNINGALIVPEEPITITTYNENGGYTVNFDNRPYFQEGYVSVELITIDTNSSALKSGAVQTAFYTSSSLPIFRDVVMNEDRTELSFKIISATELAKIASIMHSDGVHVRWRTDINTPGIITVVKTTFNGLNENGEIQYVVTIRSDVIGVIGAPFPLSIVVSASNGIGINSENI